MVKSKGCEYLGQNTVPQIYPRLLMKMKFGVKKGLD